MDISLNIPFYIAIFYLLHPILKALGAALLMIGSLFISKKVSRWIAICLTLGSIAVLITSLMSNLYTARFLGAHLGVWMNAVGILGTFVFSVGFFGLILQLRRDKYLSGKVPEHRGKL